MLHELLHGLGIVATCAPHHTRAGHVSDDPRDLMYAGDQPWQPAILDRGHDDYFAHPQNGCPDLKDSSYLIPAGTAAGKTAPPDRAVLAYVEDERLVRGQRR
jgi:hypothetical protein